MCENLKVGKIWRKKPKTATLTWRWLASGYGVIFAAKYERNCMGIVESRLKEKSPIIGEWPVNDWFKSSL